MSQDRQNTENKKGKKSRLFLLIRLLGLVLFIYILTTVDLKQLWAHLREVDTAYLLYAILFQLLLLFIKAMRWHILNDGSRLSGRIMRSFGEFFESYAIGVITPGRLGELVKAGHATEKNRVVETGIRVAVERGFDLGIFVLFAGLAFIYTFNFRASLLIGLVIAAAGIIIIALAYIFMSSRKATRVVQQGLNKVPFISMNLELSFRKRTAKISTAVILLSVVSNLSYFISCYFLALGLSIEFSFVYVSGVVALAGLLNMLPVTIMGLGTREGVFLLLFQPLAEALILAFSGLVFLVAQIGGGVVSLLLGYLFLYFSPDRRQH